MDDLTVLIFLSCLVKIFATIDFLHSLRVIRPTVVLAVTAASHPLPQSFSASSKTCSLFLPLDTTSQLLLPCIVFLCIVYELFCYTRGYVLHFRTFVHTFIVPSIALGTTTCNSYNKPVSLIAYSILSYSFYVQINSFYFLDRVLTDTAVMFEEYDLYNYTINSLSLTLRFSTFLRAYVLAMVVGKFSKSFSLMAF